MPRIRLTKAELRQYVNAVKYAFRVMNEAVKAVEQKRI